jgi:Fur family ferric uptake transcriptional regulator
MGYEIDEAEVAYWGRCPDCLAQDRTPSRTEALTRRRRSHLKNPPTEKQD